MNGAHVYRCTIVNCRTRERFAYIGARHAVPAGFAVIKSARVR